MRTLALLALLGLAACTPAGDKDADNDGFTPNEGDCDDGDPLVNPAMDDRPYDGIDADCAGDNDFDFDGDGFDAPQNGGPDCNDSNASVNPDATDTPYDGVDSDCSGNDDYDADGDGYVSDDYDGTDCDDTDAGIHPDAADTPYDGEDTDCDGWSDNDADHDGFDSDEHGGTDCDDTRDTVNTDADELCSTAWDDDCDEDVNEGDAVDAKTWYYDFDDDLHGDPDVSQTACTQPTDYVLVGDDCDDAFGDTYPGADDVPCDGRDNDCDAETWEESAIKVNGSPAAGTLASIVAGATANDTIQICEGRLVTTTATAAVGLEITSLSGDASNTLIDADGEGAVLRANTDDIVTVSDLTLTGGTGAPADGGTTLGGAVMVENGGHVVLDGVVVTGNGAGEGAGVFVDVSGVLELKDTLVTENEGYDPGGQIIDFGGGVYLAENAVLDMQTSTISFNAASGGGGVYMESNASIVGDGESEISDNDTVLGGGAPGGGVYTSGPNAISGVTIARNSTWNAGGGISHGLFGTLTLTDVVIDDNFADLSGGGINAASSVDMTRVTLTNNVADIVGGGIYSALAGTITFDDCTVDGNGADPFFGWGGGLHLDGGTIESIATDWGANSPADVWLDDAEIALQLEGEMTFTCTDVVDGTCEP